MSTVVEPARAPWWARTRVGDLWDGRWADSALWVAVLVWTALWGWARAAPSGISWHFFPTGAQLLVHPGAAGGGLHLYAAHPELQIGPVAFLVTAALTWLPGPVALAAAQVLMTAALPAALAWLSPLVGGPWRRTRIALVALVLAPTWTVLSVRWGHLDDVLALVLLCVALRAVRGEQAVLTGLALGLAAGAKPWAVLGFPLVLLLSGRAGRTRAAVLAGALAGGITLAIWLPFVLADHATLAAFHPRVGINDSTTLSLLGYRGTVIPAWDRTAQLLLAPLAALAAVRAGVWPAALLCGIAVRLALDPQDLAYYAAGAVLAAAVLDLLATRTRVPWATLVTAVVLWQPFVADYQRRFDTSTGLSLAWFQHPQLVAGIHLGWSFGALAIPVAWAVLVRVHPNGPAGAGAVAAPPAQVPPGG